MMGMMKLTSQDFSYFRDLVEEVAGINMTEKKIEMAQARLRPRLSQLGYSSFDEYKKFLNTLQPNDPYWDEFISLFTTNKTDFFREAKHFSFLQEKIVTPWLKGKDKTFKVWSCACSTGEEPYTISMVLDSALKGTQKNYKILATDVDTRVLSTASNGVYSVDRINEIPEDFKSLGFDHGTGAISGWVRVKPHIKEPILFTKHNLIENMAPTEANFDVVFCRNILIYFAKDTCEFVLEKLYKVTKPGGYLITSHSESLQGLKTSWKLVKPSIYVKKG